MTATGAYNPFPREDRNTAYVPVVLASLLPSSDEEGFEAADEWSSEADPIPFVDREDIPWH